MKASISLNMIATQMTGVSSGSVMYTNDVQDDAPSTVAASNGSLESEEMPAMMMMVTKGVESQTSAAMMVAMARPGLPSQSGPGMRSSERR